MSKKLTKIRYCILAIIAAVILINLWNIHLSTRSKSERKVNQSKQLSEHERLEKRLTWEKRQLKKGQLSPPVIQTPIIQKTPIEDFEELVNKRIKEGLIHSVDIRLNRVRIDPIHWYSLSLENKQGLVVVFSRYFKAKGSSGRVEILSNRNDIKLASYSAWRGVEIFQ